MENLKLEKLRIQAKQNQLTGLTEGQEKTLERNEQRIEALKKEIEDLEQRIHAKNAQREKTKSAAAGLAADKAASTHKKQNVNEALYGYESDEDDFYDRTTTNQRKHLERKQQLSVAGGVTSGLPAAVAKPSKSSNEVLTAESIQAKIKTLERELSENVREHAQAQTLAARDGGGDVQEQKQDAEVDSLDSFMASTTKELHSTQLSSLETRRRDLEVELRRQRQLLVVATPALAAVPTAARADVPKPVASERQLMAPPTNSSPPPPQLADIEAGDAPENSTEPQVSLKSTTTPSKRPAEQEEEETSEPKRFSIKAKQPSLPEAQANSSNTTAIEAKTQAKLEAAGQAKKRRVVGPARPPVAAMKSSSTRASTAKLGDEASTLEGGDSVWVPPTNQTGDGRTKLNDKYGY